MKWMLVKTSAILALSAAVAGCAATEDGDSTDGEEAVGTVSSALCEGWPDGRRCTGKCSDGSWYTAGHSPPLDYGECQSAAQAMCLGKGLGYAGACWSL